MVSFILRCAIAIAALMSIRYSSLHKHVDVSVPTPCVADVTKAPVPRDSGCIYRDVSVRGRVTQRDFEIYGLTGIGVFAKDVMILSRDEGAGFTWRSLALLLIAVAMWLPSLVSLFTSKSKDDDGSTVSR